VYIFFLTIPPPTVIYTLSLHDALPIWTMRMFAGFSTAEETNKRFKYLLSQGQTGLSTAFDMPTLYGYDTDHPLAAGEFGKCGVRSEEHTSELQSLAYLVCRLLLEKKNT